jgi:hypothetical protein
MGRLVYEGVVFGEKLANYIQFIISNREVWSTSVIWNVRMLCSWAPDTAWRRIRFIVNDYESTAEIAIPR